MQEPRPPERYVYNECAYNWQPKSSGLFLCSFGEHEQEEDCRRDDEHSQPKAAIYEPVISLSDSGTLKPLSSIRCIDRVFGGTTLGMANEKLK